MANTKDVGVILISDSDKKFLADLEKSGLVPKNPSPVVKEGGKKKRSKQIGQSRCEVINFEDGEDDDLILKNDPRRHKMTTIGGYPWEELGFHIV